MHITEIRMAARDAFLTRLSEASRQRPDRPGIVPGPYGYEAAWVAYEAERMLALVNEIRAENVGLPPASLDQVRRIEASASGHVDYADKYALRCAFLALGEEG